MKSHNAFISSILIFVISSKVYSSTKFIPFELNNDSRRLKSSNDKLIFAHVLYRHGERNVAKTFPNDPWGAEEHWLGGFGALTHEGKRQEYKLGQYFRRRYGKLIGDEYSSKKVYIQSTDTDRTLMSALANLAGLFPPNKKEIWNDDILWQPIPVHTVPSTMDHVLMGSRECPRYTIAYENYIKNSREVQRIYSEYGDFFLYLSKMSGANITTITDVYWLYNTLEIEKYQNKTLDVWAQNAIEPNGTMEYIATFDYKTYADIPLTARLKSGFLLKEILEHFFQKINSTLQPDRSLYLYSCHDITISNLLNALGLYELHIPPYASSLHIELFKTNDGQHFIQIFYRRFEEEEPVPMKIPKCHEKCPLEQFYAIYDEIVPGDFDSECRISPK